jgi:multidrug efflux pump subunit AcrA (membrane-fusion protein)
MSLTRILAWSSALVVPVALGCGGTAPPPAADEGEHLPRVETVYPTYQSLRVETELVATIEPMEKTDLCARVPGVVPTLSPDLDIGRPIWAGEELMRLQVPDLDAEREFKRALLQQARDQELQIREARKVAERELAEAQLLERRYQADFVLHQEKHERTRKLVERGALQPELSDETRSQVEASRAAWDASKAVINTKRAKLEATDVDLRVAATRIKVAETELARLDVMVGYARIKAPFDGVITRRWVNSGDTIKDASIPLFTVMRTDRVRVLLDIPERDVPLVHATESNPRLAGRANPGNQVTLRIPALPGHKFEGNVTRLASALDPATRTMRAEVHLENRWVWPEALGLLAGAPTGLPIGRLPWGPVFLSSQRYLAHHILGTLRPGMYGRATIVLAERTDKLVIPSTALMRRGNQLEVYYVQLTDRMISPPRGELRHVEVETGIDDGMQVEIRGGLREDMLIVAKGAGTLRSGDQVLAVPARLPRRD